MKKIIIPGLAAGVVMLVASLALSSLFGILIPQLAGEYANAALFRPWSDPLMLYIFVHPFVLGLILAYAWDKAKGLLKDKQQWMKGKKFGMFVWLLATAPGMLISMSTFPVSTAMVASWAIAGLVELALGGIVLAYMNK